MLFKSFNCSIVSSLIFDNLHILLGNLFNLELGVPNDLSLDNYKPYSKLLDKINLIIITQSNLSHAGALPLLYGKMNKPTVIATTPISRLGFIGFFDAILHRLGMRLDF